MSWDEIKRKADEGGSENPDVVLGRIDERLKGMNEKIILHIASFEEHRKEDDKNFAGIYKLVWVGVGVLVTLEFLLRH